MGRLKWLFILPVILVGLTVPLTIFSVFLPSKTSKLILTSVPVETPTSTQNQTIDTSGWKKYINTEAGFSLLYPPNAVEEGREADPFPVARQFQFSEPRKGGGGGPLTVGWLIIVSETQPNPNNLSLREWGREKKLIYTNNVIDTSFGGLLAVSWKGSVEGNFTYYLIKRTNGVTFVLSNVDLEDVAYQKIVDQIFSTFKFLP